jgi:hypothetical protein
MDTFLAAIMNSAKPERRFRIIQILVSFAIFLCLAGDAIPQFFGGDDVANLYKYYELPLSHWLMGLVRFWSSAYYRPLGGVVYLTLFNTFGFHALPFKILLFAILIANMILYLRVTGKISGSMQIAAWALLFCCYHAAMDGLYLNFGTIYDVLGYSCFFAAFLAYIVFFTAERRSFRGLLLVVLLYIIGLCSKETVVTLPVVMFAWSVIMSRSIQTERLRWPLRSGLPVIVCSMLAVIYTLGKMSGPDALATSPAYTPHFNFTQYSTRTADYLRALFYLPDGLPTPVIAVGILVLMLVIALLLRSRLMFFSAVSVMVTQLPVSFIGLRLAFVLYIPVAFWALYVAAFIDAATPLLKSPLRSLVACLAVAAILVPVHLRMKTLYDMNFVPQSIAYRELSEQLDRWNVHLAKDGHLLLVNDPFPSNWVGFDPLFLISLRDHTTHAVVNRQKISTTTPPESEVDWYDYVVDYDTTWRLLKSPGKPANATRLHEIADAAPVLLIDGFDPPSRDGWRTVHRAFAVRIKNAAAGMFQLCISLSASEPLSLSEQIDSEVKTAEVAYGAGAIQLALPVPANRPGQAHILRVFARKADARPGSPQLIFVNAELQAARRL